MARLELTIDVAPGATDDDDGVHVAGTLRREDGHETPFVGWISLLALLQQALTAAPT